jgi:hypothetical protein
MASLMLINPRKRRATAKRRKVRRNPVAKKAATNPVRRYKRRVSVAAKRRRIRRNPIGFSGIQSSLMNSVIGGAGAVGVDFIADMLPLPLSMKTGWTGVATKAALAVGVGMIGKKFLGRNAEKMAEGALTVLAYSSIKGLMPTMQTGAAINGLAYLSPAQNAGNMAQLQEYLNPDPFAGSANLSGLGEYVQY